ncbi:MAG: hypothetical protein DRR08_09370 [Candidatus Parabeggiatoa sp. nov. 2]|nr:MAG: hypothetical protein DRR08_09370 [Gammaproteobacteria bacterium]
MAKSFAIQHNICNTTSKGNFSQVKFLGNFSQVNVNKFGTMLQPLTRDAHYTHNAKKNKVFFRAVVVALRWHKAGLVLRRAFGSPSR